jgi:hypothetical protein
MRKFTGKVVFQGDIAIELVTKKLPAGCTEIKPTDGRHIAGHSETGNMHFVEAAAARFYGTSNPLVCFLKIDGEHADLVHDRPVHPHETWRLPKGTYRIRRQREHAPEGWIRAVQD